MQELYYYEYIEHDFIITSEYPVEKLEYFSGLSGNIQTQIDNLIIETENTSNNIMNIGDDISLNVSNYADNVQNDFNMEFSSLQNKLIFGTYINYNSFKA